MTKRKLLFTFLFLFCILVTFGQTTGAKKWTLQECIDYALQNNIQLKKSSVQRRSAQEDVLQSKADLLPSLSASTNQSVTYRPFVSSGQSTVANGYVQSSVDKVFDTIDQKFNEFESDVEQANYDEANILLPKI